MSTAATRSVSLFLLSAQLVTAVYNLYELYGTLYEGAGRKHFGNLKAGLIAPLPCIQVPGRDDDSCLQVRRLTCLGRPNVHRYEFLRVPSQMDTKNAHGHAHPVLIEAKDAIFDCKPVVRLVSNAIEKLARQSLSRLQRGLTRQCASRLAKSNRHR